MFSKYSKDSTKPHDNTRFLLETMKKHGKFVWSLTFYSKVNILVEKVDSANRSIKGQNIINPWLKWKGKWGKTSHHTSKKAIDSHYSYSDTLHLADVQRNEKLSKARKTQLGSKKSVDKVDDCLTSDHLSLSSTTCQEYYISNHICTCHKNMIFVHLLRQDESSDNSAQEEETTLRPVNHDSGFSLIPIEDRDNTLIFHFSPPPQQEIFNGE